MNKALIINLFAFCSSLISIFAIDDETQIINFLQSEPSWSPVYEEEILEQTDSDIDNGMQIDATLYQQFSLKLIDKVPKICGSRQGALDFITKVLMKFDLGLNWNLCMNNASYRRFLLWLSNGWWEQIKVQYSDEYNPNSKEEMKLLSLLDKIVCYRKQTKKRKRKDCEFDTLNERQELVYENLAEEDVNNDLVIAEYEKLAKKLTSFVPGKRYKGRTEEDIAYFLSCVLFKFEMNNEWNEFSLTLRVQFNYWHTNCYWQKIYDEFSLICDQSSEDDTRILSLLKIILDYGDSRPLQKKRKLKKTRINGALSI